jgi:tetraacyldisaccharide 4'-kinase
VPSEEKPGGFAPPAPPSPSLAGPRDPRSAPAGRALGAPALEARQFSAWKSPLTAVAPFTVSIGNIAMGGRGKTPTAILVARLLLDAGERPAVLSRGYGRRYVEDGAVIVSDGERLCADLDRAGDEPMLIALAVPGAAVLVCEQRAIAAALARHVLDATALVLDDGFQHRSVARHADVVIVTPKDLYDQRLPFGRLREPVRALRRAHAVVIDGTLPDKLANNLPEVLRDRPLYSMRRFLGSPSPLERDRPWMSLPAIALAGIADPDRFATALRADGWSIAGLQTFPDHHRYRPEDLERVAAAARDAGVNAVVTTEKDAVRLLPLRPFPIPIASVSLDVALEPIGTAPAFRDWLLARKSEVREPC